MHVLSDAYNWLCADVLTSSAIVEEAKRKLRADTLTVIDSSFASTNSLDPYMRLFGILHSSILASLISRLAKAVLVYAAAFAIHCVPAQYNTTESVIMTCGVQATTICLSALFLYRHRCYQFAGRSATVECANDIRHNDVVIATAARWQDLHTAALRAQTAISHQVPDNNTDVVVAWKALREAASAFLLHAEAWALFPMGYQQADPERRIPTPAQMTALTQKIASVNTLAQAAQPQIRHNREWANVCHSAIRDQLRTNLWGAAPVLVVVSVVAGLLYHDSCRPVGCRLQLHMLAWLVLLDTFVDMWRSRMVVCVAIWQHVHTHLPRLPQSQS